MTLRAVGDSPNRAISFRDVSFGLVTAVMSCLLSSNAWSQTTTVSVQCLCDLSAHPPGFDCRTYCCKRNSSLCAAPAPVPPATAPLADALTQLFSELTRERTPAEKAYAENEKGRKAYEKARKAYSKKDADEALRQLGHATAFFERASTFHPGEPIYAGNVDLARKFADGIAAERRYTRDAIDRGIQAAALAAREEQEAQVRRSQELSDALRQARASFEENKSAFLAALESGKAAAPAEHPSACLEACPTVSGPLGSRVVDPGCTRRCLLDGAASGSIPAREFLSPPEPAVVSGATDEIRESDYFFDLQTRKGPTTPAPGVPSPAGPLPDPTTRADRNDVPASGQDQDSCLAGCPSVTSTMGRKEPDHACIARCLLAGDASKSESGGVTDADESAGRGHIARLPTEVDGAALRRSALQEVPSPVRRSGDGRSILVGGTGWVFGFNIGEGNESLREEAMRRLWQQMELAGVDPEKFVNMAEYKFLIGVATHHHPVVDAVWRVAFHDQFSDGEYSAAEQPLYASLRGRKAENLDCHSNGAMVCLSALSHDDVAAGTVRLFGPQITQASLLKWQRLLDDKKIARLEIHLNQGDPIAPLSYFWAQLVALAKNPFLPTPLSVASTDALGREIHRHAPKASTVFYDSCGKTTFGLPLSLDCHDMALYQRLATAGTAGR